MGDKEKNDDSVQNSSIKLSIDNELKEGFKTEIDKGIRRHIDSLKNWRDKSLKCLRPT